MSARAKVDPVLLVYATRYAIGRRTGAPGDVAVAIVDNRAVLDNGCLDAIERDLSDHLEMPLGPTGAINAGADEMHAWRRALHAVRSEQSSREHDEDEGAGR